VATGRRRPARGGARSLDVGYGGLEHALAEAEEWSGRPAEVTPPSNSLLQGAAILACRREDVEKLGAKGVVEIGVVR
jgi:hypothetical protein